MTDAPNTGASKLICPRCGTTFLPVRGRLPPHTVLVETKTYDGQFWTKKAVVCE